ncbi:MAG TPA: SRPBCC domain-containing protein [Solirubrobacteraceae bacterium]|nr:SRPBCC domain-containing protein [Solirubrobacteraceae bacterium]
MTLISTVKEPDELSLTMVAQFDASPDRVWDVWEDPRKLERWWGPPTFPATFTRHEFTVGGQSRYFMTGPAGETPHGWWRIDAIDKPRRLEFANGLAGDDGEPMVGVEPMAGRVTFEVTSEGTRMTVVTCFTDVEQMQTMLRMGMEEGMAQAIDQIDAVLSALPVS